MYNIYVRKCNNSSITHTYMTYLIIIEKYQSEATNATDSTTWWFPSKFVVMIFSPEQTDTEEDDHRFGTVETINTATTHRNTLEHTAVHHGTPQHSATHRNAEQVEPRFDTPASAPSSPLERTISREHTQLQERTLSEGSRGEMSPPSLEHSPNTHTHTHIQPHVAQLAPEPQIPQRFPAKSAETSPKIPSLERTPSRDKCAVQTPQPFPARSAETSPSRNTPQHAATNPSTLLHTPLSLRSAATSESRTHMQQLQSPFLSHTNHLHTLPPPTPPPRPIPPPPRAIQQHTDPRSPGRIISFCFFCQVETKSQLAAEFTTSNYYTSAFQGNFFQPPTNLFTIRWTNPSSFDPRSTFIYKQLAA